MTDLSTRSVDHGEAELRRDSPAKVEIFPTVFAELGGFAVVAVVLIAAGNRDYPSLHTILDTGMLLLSGVLALLFWDMGKRLGIWLKTGIAISFAFTFALELIHAAVTIEWSGPLAPIAQLSQVLRPATWPPAAHILPIGLACALLLARPARGNFRGFLTPGLLLLGAALLYLSHLLPQYTAPVSLGITRPGLIAAPILWAAVGLACLQWRTLDRILPPLALMSFVLFLANAAMLYSQAPHDSAAIIAHLGRVAGYLAILLTLMHLASSDMLERVRAEAALADLNRDLERRVEERTAELESANRKAQAQVARLDMLNRITRAIGERQDLQSIFQVVIRSLEDNAPIDFSCVCLHDPVAKMLKVTGVGVKSAPLAMDLAMSEQANIPIDENGLSRCVRGRLVYEPDVAAVPFPFPRRLAKGGLRSLVIAPLLVESKVFGVLVAARKEAHAFSSGECEFLRQLSEHVGLASHQAQLYGALQQAYDDLRQTQQAVMQQERLRALGQMASGIAHDINNAISPVALYTEALLETEPNLTPRARSNLEIIQRAMEDVAHTVARMREFYRAREPQLALAPVDMNRLVQQVLDLTRARWSDMPQQRGIVIRLQRELAPALPKIMGAESEIREALINLVFNAVDAMPEGGQLTLKTHLATAGNPDPGHVQVSVSDDGVGMDEDTRRRCLEPFFTTKGERGTGLGLAMVYGVVRRHSAELEIESVPGKGTTMRLSFPVSVVVETAVAAQAPVVRTRLRLLLVDDDPLLLKSLRDVLEPDGHVIVTANDGRSGIDTFRAATKRNERFDAVITDLGMPYVDGRQVAEAVKRASPSTLVILLTGWGQRLVAEGEVPQHVDSVISKPPKLREIREALANRRAAGAA